MGKKFWHSKTFWFNVVSGIAIAVQSQTGFLIDEEAQAGIIIVINLFLRAITSEPLTA